MEIAQQKPIEEEVKKEAPLTREQRRFKERIEKDAESTHRKLCETFFTFFMDNDPDGEEVADMEKEVCAKWRMYCGSRQLVPEAKDLVSNYCKAVRNEFNKAKNDNAQTGPIPGN